MKKYSNFFTCNKPVTNQQVCDLPLCFSWCFAVWEFLCQMCPVLASAEMSTEVTVPCVTHWPGFAHSRIWHLCKYAGADTLCSTLIFLRNLFLFFNDVVDQRKRLIWISLRADSVKMTRSNWVTRLFYLLHGLFLQRPLGVPAQAEAPVAPRSCPEMRSISSGAWGSCTKTRCAEQGSPCPRQELPSPTASPGQHLRHVVAPVSFCSRLRQLNNGWFFPLFL